MMSRREFFEDHPTKTRIRLILQPEKGVLKLTEDLPESERKIATVVYSQGTFKNHNQMFHVKHGGKMTQNEGVRIIDRKTIQETSERALRSPRKRINYNFHQLEDRVQRMLNAMEPETYVRPHRHIEPPKIECFLILRGKCTVILFNDVGTITDCIPLDGKENVGIDISPGVWHSVICDAPGTVLFETKDGPYVPATDKDFAVWAPIEGDPAAAGYREETRDLVRRILKQRNYRSI
jgi:cupin fold WbuC family metalloprotein